MSIVVYIGPYVRFPVAYRELEKAPTYVCSARCPDHREEMSPQRFCMHCGAPMQEQRSTVKKPFQPMPFDIPGEQFVDLMWGARSMDPQSPQPWLPNKAGVGINVGDGYPLGEFALKNEAEEWAKFEAQYGEFIAAAEKHLGIKAERCYGVVAVD